MSSARRTKITARILSGEEIAIGPGKADLLDAIAQTGSISAAGRALGMSYRRTWMLVDVMNRCWREPLVATATGGVHGGGATLTPRGRDVLAAYRAWQRALADAEGAAVLLEQLAPRPRPPARSG